MSGTMADAWTRGRASTSQRWSSRARGDSRALLVEVVYFWALSASPQAVLTPDLGETFPDPLYFPSLNRRR